MTTTKPKPTDTSRSGAESGVIEMALDPITRIVGSLGIYATIDFDNNRVLECHSTSSVFRGYSIFMKGKDPRDAHFITSRICGICGDNHATCSVYAQNMAYGVRPPHLGEWMINLGEAAEHMFDHNIFQENLVGVDYCEKMVAETNPGVLERANESKSPRERGLSSKLWLAGKGHFKRRRAFCRCRGPLASAKYPRGPAQNTHVGQRKIPTWRPADSPGARPHSC